MGAASRFRAVSWSLPQELSNQPKVTRNYEEITHAGQDFISMNPRFLRCLRAISLRDEGEIGAP
jgi:hypothetical protein